MELSKEELLNQLSKHGDKGFQKWREEIYLPAWNKMMDGKFIYDKMSEADKMKFNAFEEKVNIQTEAALSYLHATLKYNEIRKLVEQLQQDNINYGEETPIPISVQIELLHGKCT